MNKDEEDFIFVTNSFRRVDVLCALDELKFARNYEIADMLLLRQANTSSMLNKLVAHNLVKKEKVDNRSIYSLTEQGEKIVTKLKDYYGIDRK